MGLNADYSRGEPQPINRSDSASMHDLVIKDLEKMGGLFTSLVIEELKERKKFGLQKYGTVLQAHNGRVPLRDALDELLDLLVYLRQDLAENPDSRFTRELYDLIIEKSADLVVIANRRKEVRGR